MSFTKITSTNIANGAITFAQTAAGAFTLIPTITNVQIADSSYNVLDDTAANTGGGFVVITGSNFGSSSQVIIGTTNATSTTYVNSTTIRAQIPAASAATYTVYVVDTVTGATAIRVNGLTYSSFPAWSTGSTLSNQEANTSFAVSISANSDSSITYANTTALPAGTTLAANGYFSGTVTIGAQTTYSFDVKATDVENQDNTRTFSLTVTVIPPYYLYTWGRNHVGQLGTNNTINTSSPTQIGSDITWNNIDGGKFHSMATKTNGTLWTWGSNNLSQLGININNGYRSSPVQVGALTNWTLVKCSNYHTTAIKSDGTLWSWGYNAQGMLGLNDRIYRSSPTQIGSGTTWLNLAGGGYHNIATKTDGTLWVWGVAGNGRLGLGNTIYRSSPTQVGSATDWSKVFAGNRSSLAIKTNGTLWFAGESTAGISGTNVSGGELLTFVQIGSGTDWSKVDITKNFAAHVLAIKTNGTLWSWGRNDNGQLGTNDLTYKSSPTQVGSGTTWSEISSGWQFSGAIKTDGTLWTWGRNNLGQLGGFGGSYVTSPVQVGVNTTWSKIEDLETSFIAIRS
jgi:alpha-tubulin suppressor-like RCC1 family protein